MSTLAKARAAWGSAPPRWIVALANACDASTKKDVARQVGISDTAVHLLLANRYTGSLPAMQKRIEAALTEETRAAAAPGWGVAPPAWVVALAQACEAMSQVKAAKRIGYSPAVVSQVLRNTYRGDMRRVEAMVRGFLMGEELDCPVFGPSPIDSCVRNQERIADPKAPRHVMSRALAQQCPSCRHNLKNGD